MPSSYSLTRSSGMFQPTNAPISPPPAVPAPARAVATPSLCRLRDGRDDSAHGASDCAPDASAVRCLIAQFGFFAHCDIGKKALARRVGHDQVQIVLGVAAVARGAVSGLRVFAIREDSRDQAAEPSAVVAAAAAVLAGMMGMFIGPWCF